MVIVLDEYYPPIEDDPFECSMFGCDETAVFLVAGWSCGDGCDHMHRVPAPMCDGHARAAGREIVGTTGD
jgi:hypothetical protein